MIREPQIVEFQEMVTIIAESVRLTLMSYRGAGLRKLQRIRYGDSAPESSQRTSYQVATAVAEKLKNDSGGRIDLGPNDNLIWGATTVSFQDHLLREDLPDFEMLCLAIPLSAPLSVLEAQIKQVLHKWKEIYTTLYGKETTQRKIRHRLF